MYIAEKEESVNKKMNKDVGIKWKAGLKDGRLPICMGYFNLCFWNTGI